MLLQTVRSIAPYYNQRPTYIMHLFSILEGKHTSVLAVQLSLQDPAPESVIDDDKSTSAHWVDLTEEEMLNDPAYLASLRQLEIEEEREASIASHNDSEPLIRLPDIIEESREQRLLLAFTTTQKFWQRACQSLQAKMTHIGSVDYEPHCAIATCKHRGFAAQDNSPKIDHKVR